MVSEIGKNGPIDTNIPPGNTPVLSQEEGDWVAEALASIKEQKPIEVLHALCLHHQKEDGLTHERALFLVEKLRDQLRPQENKLIDDELIESFDSPEFASLLEEIQKHPEKHPKLSLALACKEVREKKTDPFGAIKKYHFTHKSKAGQQAIIEIAKINAAQSGWRTSLNIKNYGIEDHQVLAEIAKIVAAQDGENISRFIHNYGIKDQQALIEIAKIAATQDGEATSKHIKNYGIEDHQALAEIAKIAAAQDGGGTSEYIKNYGIEDQQALAEIAKIAAAQDVVGTSRQIHNYAIKSPTYRDEIAKFLIANMTAKIGSIASIYSQEVVFLYIDSLLTRDDKKNSSLNSAKAFLDLGDDLGKKNISSVHQDVIGLCPSTLNLKQNDLIWLDEALAKAKEPFMKERLLDWFIKTSAICAFHPELSDVMSSTKLLEVIAKRDPLLRVSLTKELVEASFNKKLTPLTNSLSNEPKEIPLRIPKLILANYPDDCQEASQKLIQALNQSKFRVAYKDGKKQTLLIEALLGIKNSSLGNQEKSALLTSLSKMDVESQLKALRLISDILAFKGDDKLKGAHTLTDLQNYLSTLFAEKFDIKLENFQEKYDQTIGTWRRKEALITYAGKLNLLAGREKTEALKLLKEVVTTVLEGSFEKTRNSSLNNPHLAEIEKSSPEVFKKWQEHVMLEPSEMALSETSAEKSFLKAVKEQLQMAIQQHHLGSESDYTRLTLGLQDPSTQLGIVDEEFKALSDQADPKNNTRLLIEKGIYELLLLPEDKENLRNKLNDINRLLDPGSVFKTDIEACLAFLEEKKSGGGLEVLESTDPNDFLLMGTEVLGSCQKVDGAPNLNKCLLGYCLDGKHRLLLIKQEGKIVARSVARLLIDEKGSPVLFQERNYYAENNPAFDLLLRKLAIKKAKQMGVPLAVSKTDFEKETLVSYPTPLNAKAKPVPFEYVDAAGGIQTGPYKIKDAMQVK